VPVLWWGPSEPWSCLLVGAMDEAEAAWAADDGLVDNAVTDEPDVAELVFGVDGDDGSRKRCLV